MALEVAIQRRLKNFTLDIHFSAQKGCLGILGASGCGKSMTLKSIAGIQTPDGGRIALDGRVLFDSEKKVNLPPQQRRVGYLFQSYALFPNMTVGENIAAGLRTSREMQGKTVAKMTQRFRLKGLEERYPAQLSGGQQQRVALARILAYEPEVLLLDEPFSALDAFLKEELQVELAEILGEYGGTAILVTHNRDEVYRLSHELMIIHQGRMLSIGDTRETFKRPKSPQAARLTGCKNISRAQKTGENTVLALDWGSTLRVAEPVPAGITHVGVRAHDLFPAQMGEENAMGVTAPRLSQAPFEWNVIYQAGEGENGLLWWKVEKNIWAQVEEELPDALAVAPEHVLLLTEP